MVWQQLLTDSVLIWQQLYQLTVLWSGSSCCTNWQC